MSCIQVHDLRQRKTAHALSQEPALTAAVPEPSEQPREVASELSITMEETQMSKDEVESSELYTSAKEALGDKEAGILMERLPPIDWQSFATKADVEKAELNLREQAILEQTQLEKGLADAKVERADVRSDMDKGFTEAAAERIRSDMNNGFTEAAADRKRHPLRNEQRLHQSRSRTRLHRSRGRPQRHPLRNEQRLHQSRSRTRQRLHRSRGRPQRHPLRNEQRLHQSRSRSATRASPKQKPSARKASRRQQPTATRSAQK